MEINREKFMKMFADDLNRLDLAFEVLAAGLENSYGGNVECKLAHSSSANVWAKLHIIATSELRWGNGWQDWAATGQIEWFTSSGHYVRFEFSKPDNYGEIQLDRLIIADDESEVFYPQILDVCISHSLEIEKCQR